MRSKASKCEAITDTLGRKANERETGIGKTHPCRRIIFIVKPLTNKAMEFSLKYQWWTDASGITKTAETKGVASKHHRRNFGDAEWRKNEEENGQAPGTSEWWAACIKVDQLPPAASNCLQLHQSHRIHEYRSAASSMVSGRNSNDENNLYTRSGIGRSSTTSSFVIILENSCQMPESTLSYLNWR